MVNAGDALSQTSGEIWADAREELAASARERKPEGEAEDRVLAMRRAFTRRDITPFAMATRALRNSREGV